MTFYHYIEEQEQVSYRYFKNFSGNYINKNNVNKKNILDLCKKIRRWSFNSC